MVIYNMFQNNIHIKIIRKWKAGKFNEKNLYKGWMPPHPTTFFIKKEFLKLLDIIIQNIKYLQIMIFD